MDDLQRIVLDISSDEDVGFGKVKSGYDSGGGGGGGGGGSQDFDWIRELLDDDKESKDDDDKEFKEDGDEVEFVREVISKPKQGWKPSAAIGKASAGGDDDDDCVVLDGDPQKPVEVQNNGTGDSDELLVVGERGEVVARQDLQGFQARVNQFRRGLRRWNQFLLLPQL